jgi:hypothetical protein
VALFVVPTNRFVKGPVGAFQPHLLISKNKSGARSGSTFLHGGKQSNRRPDETSDAGSTDLDSDYIEHIDERRGGTHRSTTHREQ